MATATATCDLDGLATRAQAGDSNAFASLWKALNPEILRFVCRHAPVGAAEDLTQDTFLKAWTGLSSWRPEVGSVRAWLYAIAKNVVIDHLRYTGRRPVAATDYMGTEFADDCDVAEEVTDRVAVTIALTELPTQQRQVVELRYLADLSVAQTAAALAIPAGTVKSATSRGIRALAGALTGPVRIARPALAAVEPTPADAVPAAVPAPATPAPRRSARVLVPSDRLGGRRRRHTGRPVRAVPPARAATGPPARSRPADRRPANRRPVTGGGRPTSHPAALDARHRLGCRRPSEQAAHHRVRPLHQRINPEGGLTVPTDYAYPALGVLGLWLLPSALLFALALAVEAIQEAEARRTFRAVIAEVKSRTYSAAPAPATFLVGRIPVEKVVERGAVPAFPDGDEAAMFLAGLMAQTPRRLRRPPSKPGRHRPSVPAGVR